MRLMIFSDIHGDRRALETALAVEADYYIAAGDLLTWGRGAERAGPLLGAARGPVYVLPGNHESAAQVARLCGDHGLNDLHGRAIEVAGYQVAGLGYSNPTPFDTPGEYSERELAERLAAFADLKPLVLVCHAPPKDTALDRIREGLHAGSTAVREFIERHQPRYFFCGHIHEAEGVQVTIGETQAVNVGKRGYLLEL